MFTMGWKGKFIFLLIVYFAGFATAVYWLVPADEFQTACEEDRVYSAVKSDEFVKSFSAGMHKYVDKCLDFSKTTASDM